MTIKLLQVPIVDPESLESLLRRRETMREFSDEPITLAQLSQLLYSAQGKRPGSSKLTAPSAQEQYPLSIFIAANNINDINAGLYHYDVTQSELEHYSSNILGNQLADAAIGDQSWIAQAAAVIVLMGDIDAMNRHFATQPPLNQRGERYVYIEAGAVAQNIHLQATELDLGMVLVGGFDNEQVKRILNQAAELEPLALICLGNL